MVTAELPCLSSTPEDVRRLHLPRRVFAATVAVRVKHPVFFLFGRYWRRHGLGAYDTSLRPMGPLQAAASRSG